MYWLIVEKKQTVKAKGLQKKSKINEGKLIILSKCTVCHTGKSWFFREQVAGLLGTLGIKTPLSNTYLVGHPFV